jgi:RND family efflux transporter MFP subunit
VLESVADPVIAAEVAGRVIEVRAAAGSEVRRGELLAMLDSGDTGLTRQAAQAEVRRVEALSENQAHNLARLRQLREQNFISQAALDDAVTQQTATQDQLAAARAQLALAERNVGKTRIVSPVDGRVEKQIAVAGQYVRQGDPLFRVVSLYKLRARLSFPETLAGKVGRGMKVKLNSAGSSFALSGRIAEITPMSGAANRAFDAYVLLDNPGDWKPGATVTGSVLLEEHADAVSVPEQSVVLRPAGTVLYVVQNGKAQQRLVQTGVSQDGWVEIVQGVRANETVAVEGAGFLSDGASVTLANPQPAAVYP